MKRRALRIRKGYFIALACVMMFTMALAATTSYGADLKIGYVDLRLALNESDAGKKAKAELESVIKTKQTAIDEKGKNIEKLKGDLEKQQSVLSADAKKTKEEEIERLVREYQRLVQDSQAEVKKREDKHTEIIVKELREIIEKIGNEDGYSLILENVEGFILYAKKDLDLTDRLIKRYNESKAKAKGEGK